jgi:signal transduction histidine kinase
VTAGLLAAGLAAVWGAPSLISYGVAWISTMYGFAVWARPRRFALGVAAITLANLAADAGPAHPNALPFTVVTLIALILVHRIVVARDQRAQIAERERDVAAGEAIVEERGRTARELHDVIARHVSMMVVQAGAERRVLAHEAGSTREVLQTIEQSGRSALTEMHRLLGILRTGADETRAPEPGLDDVPRLVAQLREAGLPVDLRVDGVRPVVPLGIDLSAYRIVQEALTNALKHAGEARATVSIRYTLDSLEFEIADDGAGKGASHHGEGHGLIGMRERVILYLTTVIVLIMPSFVCSLPSWLAMKLART